MLCHTLFSLQLTRLLFALPLQPLRNVLGQQLLRCSDYDCEQAICTTELLKLRFGEAALHACEVRTAAVQLSSTGSSDQLQSTFLWPNSITFSHTLADTCSLLVGEFEDPVPAYV